MKVTIKTEIRSFKGLTGFHSKYGGGRPNLIDNQKGTDDQSWYCQTCAHEFPTILSPIKIEIAGIGYIRICPDCYLNSKFNSVRCLD